MAVLVKMVSMSLPFQVARLQLLECLPAQFLAFIAKALAALIGKLYAVDVLVPGVGVAIYKDLGSVSVQAGQRLSAGRVIGTVGGGGDSPGSHFALLSGGKAQDKNIGNSQRGQQQAI
jgi:hypothetical protein